MYWECFTKYTSNEEGVTQEELEFIMGFVDSCRKTRPFKQQHLNSLYKNDPRVVDEGFRLTKIYEKLISLAQLYTKWMQPASI